MDYVKVAKGLNKDKEVIKAIAKHPLISKEHHYDEKLVRIACVYISKAKPYSSTCIGNGGRKRKVAFNGFAITAYDTFFKRMMEVETFTSRAKLLGSIESLKKIGGNENGK